MSDNDEKEGKDLFGTPPHELHRKEGPPTSIAGAYSVKTHKTELEVYRAIEATGTFGATNHELQMEGVCGGHLPTITPRVTKLFEKKLIFPLRQTRMGGHGVKQRVMVSIKFAKIFALEALPGYEEDME
jgi:hypothetical protein